MDYFKFVGRIIGKAVYDGQLMDAHFTRSFYKHLLGNPVEFTDIEATEPDYYKVLKQIVDNPLEYLMIDLTFSADIQRFGRDEVVDLIPNGRNIPVTDENKVDYITSDDICLNLTPEIAASILKKDGLIKVKYNDLKYDDNSDFEKVQDLGRIDSFYSKMFQLGMGGSYKIYTKK